MSASRAEHELHVVNPNPGDKMNQPLSTTSTSEAIVTTTKPAIIPFGRSVGKKTNTILQVETLLANGDSVIVFRCSDCGKDFDTYLSTMSHRRTHTPADRAGKKGGSKIEAVAREMSDLRKQVRALERRLAREQSRRKSAEKRLKDIDRMFGSL